MYSFCQFKVVSLFGLKSTCHGLWITLNQSSNIPNPIAQKSENFLVKFNNPNLQSQIEDECTARPDPEVKRRNSFSEAYVEETLKNMACYSVGMVMRHKKYNYYCVINGWDPICKATPVSIL